MLRVLKRIWRWLPSLLIDFLLALAWLVLMIFFTIAIILLV